MLCRLATTKIINTFCPYWKKYNNGKQLVCDTYLCKYTEHTKVNNAFQMKQLCNWVGIMQKKTKTYKEELVNEDLISKQ